MLSHNRKSILLFALMSTLIMAWGSVPDWAGYAAQDSHSSFTGTYFDAQDYAVHVAMIRAGMQGAWGYNLRFTSEPQQTAYIRLFYVVLGEADRVLNIDPELLYQIVRW